MKFLSKKNAAVFIDLLPPVLVLLCTVAVILFCPPSKINYDNTVTPLNDGWTSGDGEEVSISRLPEGDVTLTHDLAGVNVKYKRLCFKTTHTTLSAAFDGQTLYEYAPSQAAILGKSYGMYIHMVPIPEGVSSITLTLHPLYDGTSAEISNISVEDSGIYMGDIYHNGLPNFALCMIISTFGIIMLGMGLITHRAYENSAINFLSLGSFALLLGIWSANDTMILQVFTQRPEIVRFVNYLILMFLSYLPVSFLTSATNYKDSLIKPIMVTLTTVNFIATMMLSLVGMSDIRQMLPFSHANVAIALVMSLYLIIRASIKKTVEKGFLRWIIGSMLFIAVGVGADLVRYQLDPSSTLGATFFTRLGVLMFIAMMCAHLVKDWTNFAVERGQAELMRKMAYTDGLTELSNRAAFHEKEDQIRRDRMECFIIQLDINFLKKVNDVYGHAEGDRHIINASHIIRDSFGGIGEAFRTGGDEFIVITNSCVERDVEKSVMKMEKMVSDYNIKEKPPVLLQIAYGYAYCSMHTDMLEEAERTADIRMYEKKKSMKEEK